MLLDRLHQRYAAVSPGNGPRYVVAEHVRNRAGFYANRTCDAMVVDTWPSGGLALHGFEVKCSRADWLRELADPSKAQAFVPFCSRWWLVVADRAMVKPGELPENWGLIAARDGGLRVVTSAPVRPAEPLPWQMGVALLRATRATARSRALGSTPAEEAASEMILADLAREAAADG